METKSPSFSVYVSEFVGTALLVLLGISVVTLIFGEGTFVADIIPSLRIRRIISGFIFGSIGAIISVTKIGRLSGAHINPAVTMVFLFFGKIDLKTSVGYVLAQFAGAVAGALPLLAWGDMGASIEYGATVPGAEYPIMEALFGEFITTFIMVTLLVLFLAFRETRSFTPLIFPIIYAIMVPLEAPLSGISTNPARSFGPAVVSGEWKGFWIYIVGPYMGALVASILCSSFAKRITQARVYQFDSNHDLLLRKRKNV